jgi:hypothetical protein
VILQFYFDWNEITFISSTKEGNPPIAMKVRSAVVYIIIEHLVWKIWKWSGLLICIKPFASSINHMIYLDRTVTVPNLVEDSAKTKANADINTQTHPVVSYVPVHIHEWPTSKHKELRREASLFPPSEGSSSLRYNTH